MGCTANTTTTLRKPCAPCKRLSVCRESLGLDTVTTMKTRVQSCEEVSWQRTITDDVGSSFLTDCDVQDESCGGHHERFQRNQRFFDAHCQLSCSSSMVLIYPRPGIGHSALLKRARTVSVYSSSTFTSLKFVGCFTSACKIEPGLRLPYPEPS